MRKKYRIKTITYKSGRKLFRAQVSLRGIWFNISFDGKPYFGLPLDKRTKEEALSAIDKHIKGNHKINTIDIERMNEHEVLQATKKLLRLTIDGKTIGFAKPGIITRQGLKRNKRK